MIALFISLLGGIALWASQPPRRANWLQWPALIALIWACQSASSLAQAALCGLAFALGYVGLQLAELRLHPLISGVLALSQGALWTFIALGAAYFGRRNSLAAPFLIASSGALGCWIEWSLLPLWGTAQSFARGWSRAPRWVQFVEHTGICGAVWCLFWLAALGARLVLQPREWGSTLTALAATSGGLAGLNFLGWKREAGAPTLRVAAFGWGETAANFDRDVEVARASREAAEQGAALLVLPEAAFQIEDRAAFRRVFGDLAKSHGIALAVGYFDLTRNCNCIDFIDARGEVQSRYLKTRLVPIFEQYTRGKGEMAGLEIGGARIGGLICQDDNFASSAAPYGRSPTQMLAIPTHDWRAVKDFHAANALWRGLEFRLGLIKATSGGISFIASPRGEILARCDHLAGDHLAGDHLAGDHLASGAGLLIAEMPLSSGKMSLYARRGDWFPLACGAAVLMGLWLFRQ